jgi:fructokinase
MNRQAFALGETVLDIIFENSQPVKAVPGGSMLNAAVSLGRMNLPVELISEFGYDPAGSIISGFLNSNGVGTAFCSRYPSNNTSIALAFLNNQKNAAYSFHHDAPEILHADSLPDFTENDILLFGSFYSIKPLRRRLVKEYIRKASEADTLLIYDPNIRNHVPVETDEIRNAVFENMQYATIVKGSDDDFNRLLGTSDPDLVYDQIRRYCSNLIITRGGHDVLLYTATLKKSFPVEFIVPVSTIGAGDNFNAGLAFGLIKHGLNKGSIPKLKSDGWQEIIQSGITFSKASCASIENYIPADFLKNHPLFTTD